MSAESIKILQEFHDKLLKDPVRLREFARKVLGPPHRTLEGAEKDAIWLLLQFMSPVSESNNQITSTEVYKMSGNEYRVTYAGSDMIIDEYLPETPSDI